MIFNCICNVLRNGQDDVGPTLAPNLDPTVWLKLALCLNVCWPGASKDKMTLALNIGPTEWLTFVQLWQDGFKDG